jgi:hypothetical protein
LGGRFKEREEKGIRGIKKGGKGMKDEKGSWIPAYAGMTVAKRKGTKRGGVLVGFGGKWLNC